MLSIDDFLKKSERRAKIHKNFRGKADIFFPSDSIRLLHCKTPSWLIQRSPLNNSHSFTISTNLPEMQKKEGLFRLARAKGRTTSDSGLPGSRIFQVSS